jgi:hypothetical protein
VNPRPFSNTRATVNSSPNPGTPNDPLPDATARTHEQWRQYNAQLLDEIARLQSELAEWRDCCNALNQMVAIPESVREFCQLSKEEVFTLIKGEPSFGQLLTELKTMAGH